MTPEDIKLAALLFPGTKPQSQLNSVPFAIGDPREEEELQRRRALYEAGRAKSRQAYSQAPLSDRLMATGKGLGYMGSAMLESMGDPYAKLAGKTTEGALTQYFTPKTPAEGAVLSEMANALQPVASFLQDAKIPDITPGMLTSPTRLIDDAARQASMGLQKGAKAAARSTEDFLRSEFAKAPVGSIKLPETQREPDVNPLGFYSELGRAADSLRQEKGTGQQFLSQLRSMPGVKADELKWTGLDDFLSKKDKVTKSEIKDYLNANKVDVQEVRLGNMRDQAMQKEQEAAGKLVELINAQEGSSIRIDGTQGKVFSDEALYALQDGTSTPSQFPPEFQAAANNYLMAHKSAKGALNTNTKFSSYSVPGGKNYRELLLTLPESPEAKMFRDLELRVNAGERLKPEELQKYYDLVDAQAFKGQFHGTHFDQPNILAHMRVSDFEQDGKKIMLVDEIQSDWGQQGRDKGFVTKRGELPAGWKAFQDEKSGDWYVIDNTNTQVGVYAPTKKEAILAATGGFNSGIPSAPFVTSTEGWVNLTLRRAIQEASEKGFDKVAIPVGSIQADRYNLSKHLSAIDYRKNDDGTYGLIGFDKNDNSVISENRLTEKQLADTIGKEMAQKIIKGEGEGFPDGTAPQREGYKKLAGVDLEVGGEGMKKFYDQIVPKYLNKLGSKFGTKVTRGTITDAKGNDVPVHEMTITPQMRESVLKKGQPLFAAVPAVGLTQEEEGYAAGGAIKKTGKAAKKAAKAADLEAEYSQLKAALEQVREGGRTPVVPAPNRWFMSPEKFPGPQNMIERALANVNQERSAFGSGAYINPITGEILDSAVMENLLVAIDPKTGRPMMSGRMTDLEELEKSLGSQTFSNLVRKGLFKHSGGDPILADLPFIATIEKGPHFYGLSTEYASPAMLFNTGKGDNPTLRPKSRGSVFAVGDEVGEVQLQGRPHPVYEKLMVAPVGSDVQGKLLKKAAGGAIKKAAKAAKAASKASEVKEQPIYWGMYRGYVGDDVSSTEPQFAAMDKNVAEYYARKRAAQTGLPPHLEMIYKQLDAGRKYGHTVPIDQHNRELLITQAYELQPEDIKGRYQLKKHGGRVKGNI